jgi:hypothetical protein
MPTTEQHLQLSHGQLSIALITLAAGGLAGTALTGDLAACRRRTAGDATVPAIGPSTECAAVVQDEPFAARAVCLKQLTELTPAVWPNCVDGGTGAHPFYLIADPVWSRREPLMGVVTGLRLTCGFVGGAS